MTGHKDTISAISTPRGSGAIGVVRLCGSDAKRVLGSVWINETTPVDKFVTHRLYYGKIGQLSTAIDTVMAVWFEAPHSYTGEEMCEIYCHGGELVTQKVLKNLINAGSRLAEPGEFTRRAFMNGKIDLVQAEAVADIIAAGSERALGNAEAQLRGRLSEEIHTVERGILEILAYIEATIDFPEEEIDRSQLAKISATLDSAAKKVAFLRASYMEGRCFRDGVRVVITGAPNVGKSSLLNALIGFDRAIVSAKPGTTRDTIEEAIEIDGFKFVFVDGAGIRDSACEIEQAGVKRIKDAAHGADIVITVLDATPSPNPLPRGERARERVATNANNLIIHNKADLLTDHERCDGHLYVSAKTGHGINELKKQLVTMVTKTVSDTVSEGLYITNERHARALEGAEIALSRAAQNLASRDSAEFLALNLRAVLDSLGRLTGGVTTEDILSEIFGRFCIGK